MKPLRTEARQSAPSQDAEGAGVALGGRLRTIRFPPVWHAWFARQSEPRLAALDELVDAHLERRALRRYLRRLKHATVLAFVAAAAAAHWFSDQVAWLAAHIPALRALWKLLTGG
ncbi:hypothetical protein ASG32_26805 [Methylobacterium sp. Leaf361]|uniref:hypothetical protein n=1 Tax=Methylobacterium sp. Leaf361 TaxID=1736352 RepID=UPI0006FA4FF2|nr:hypothetical protein [Methylobacterium sp. Leaf361]KQS76768.1 hypothetical protein ASG32_26805 [Methylobacterium sp. Leaf361]